MPVKNDKSYLIKLLLIALGILIFSIIILSLVPPTTKDELVHHLAVPKLYLEHGGMYEIPFMEYSYYPMNLDLLYMIPLYLGNDIAPKLIHFAFALLTCWLIFYYLKKRTNILYALFGGLFFLSIPIIVKLSITAYIDLGEIFFSFAALIMLLEWMNKDFRLKYLIWSGILCGLALGTKYNGLVALAILTLFVPFICSRYHDKKAPGFIRPAFHGIIFLFISLLVFSPWMIRNYHWKGNPIYPLYNQVFNPPKKVERDISLQADNVKKGSKSFFTNRALFYNETGLQIALLPVRIFFQGRDDSPQYFDGKLNPFLLFLPFFAFCRVKDEPESLMREKKVFLVFSVLFFSFAFFSSGLRIRYIAPIIPPLTVLSVFGLINIVRIAGLISSRIARRAWVTLVILIPCTALALNAGYIVGQFKSVDPIPFITGKISRDEYISKYVPEYPAVRFINNNVDTSAKILFIYTGKRGYYCDRDYLFNEDMGILKRSITNAKKPEDISKDLKQKGITHMLVGYRLFEEWMKNNFSAEQQTLTQTFFKEQMDLLYGENGFGVSALK
jgi:4-amino-4-deoxy-L-arabinose transferase-like glycosyltransferase